MLSGDKQLDFGVKLKSFFFDLLSYKKNAGNASELYHNFLYGLKDLLSASHLDLFLYNKWTESYVLEFSTKETNGKTKKNFTDIKEWLDASNIENSSILAGPFVIGDDQISPNYIVLIKNNDQNAPLEGWLEITLSSDIKEQEDIKEQLEIVGRESSKIFNVWKHHFGYDSTRYEQLYRVTAKFYSSMDMDDVLGEIINTLEDVYPSFECYLLLSHDSKNHKGLPVQDLQFGGEKASNPIAAQAYLSGVICYENISENGRSILYAPLKGKQGIYGVLQLTAPESLVFPRHETEFIELLANTAGIALENAQLYLQSRRLISDLQLINKTSHRLNSNLRLSETINFMSEQIGSSFRSDEIAFVIFLKDSTFKVLNGSTRYFREEQAKVLLTSLNEKIKNGEESLFIGDMSTDPTIIYNELHSLMAIPMIQSGVLKGAVYVFHREPYFFSFENFKLLQSLVHHSTLAFANSMLREELEKLVITDNLTNLYSRNYLDEKIQNSMEKDGYGTFLLIDIDDFKSINDTYGHSIGDEVIIQVANIIRGNIREEDIGARWGGEELAVYLPKIDIETGVSIGNRLVQNVQELTHPKITISCGVAYWDRQTNVSVKKLFNCADQALYHAKHAGKNQVVLLEENDQ